MNQRTTPDAYGVLTEPTTLKIQRLLPGPIERVWAYLTESKLHRQWLAAGQMEMKVGAPVEFVWRNDELTNPSGQRPPGFADEHRMQIRITELDPPRKLTITWQGSGEASFELEPKGNEVLLRHVPPYEQYWTPIQKEPDKPHWLSNKLPTPGEVEWARFAAHTVKR
jgi:uncharacterized protein YndB with AHSA1/START domain